jgi:hypothetical protein
LWTMTPSTRRRLFPTLLLGSALALLAATGLLERRALAEAPTYEIRKTAAPATAGAPSTVSVTVVGKNGWHVNGEAPITATVKADPGIELQKAKLTRADLAETSKESARFDIPYSAAEAGKRTITAQTRFVMCQEQACKPASETVAFEVDVLADVVAAPSAGARSKGKASAAERRATDGKVGGKADGKSTPPKPATP